MDRIYFFRLTKADNRPPVFRKVMGDYEIFYLQLRELTDREMLPLAKLHMEKGISRIASWYQEDGCCQPDEKMTVWLAWEPGFDKWLREKRLQEYWQKLWDLPVYNQYGEPHNLWFLLARLPGKLPSRLLVLGDGPGMGDWLEQLARYMKEICIYAENEPRGFERLRERLMEEWGLLLKWEQTLQPEAKEAALVLDYTERDRVYVWNVAPGSVWIDMTSNENHRRAVQDRDTGIQYLSLKGIWREEMQQTLDTVDKIKYNTEVKLEGKMGV